jgi:hypothetical protein
MAFALLGVRAMPIYILSDLDDGPRKCSVQEAPTDSRAASRFAPTHRGRQSALGGAPQVDHNPASWRKVSVGRAPTKIDWGAESGSNTNWLRVRVIRIGCTRAVIARLGYIAWRRSLWSRLRLLAILALSREFGNSESTQGDFRDFALPTAS